MKNVPKHVKDPPRRAPMAAATADKRDTELIHERIVSNSMSHGMAVEQCVTR